MQIVVIRFSSMGDIVLQTSFLKWLRTNYPQAKINYIVADEYKSLLSSSEYIDQVIGLNRKNGIRELFRIKEIIEQQLKADIVFDLHNTLRGKILKILCCKTLFIPVDKNSFARNLLVRTKINLLKDQESIHYRYINDFAFMSGKDVSNKDYPMTRLGEFKSTEKFIIVSPVASFENKIWPLDNYRRLIEKILSEPRFEEYQIRILGGPSDAYCSEVVVDDSRVENLQGKLNLAETRDLISRATLTITNDTGVGHISESYNVPVIAFFGPTVKEFGFAPHLPKSVVLEASTPCRPCSTTGKDPCSQKSLLCMEEIKVEKAFEAFNEVIQC